MTAQCCSFYFALRCNFAVDALVSCVCPCCSEALSCLNVAWKTFSFSSGSWFGLAESSRWIGVKQLKTWQDLTQFNNALNWIQVWIIWLTCQNKKLVHLHTQPTTLFQTKRGKVLHEGFSSTLQQNYQRLKTGIIWSQLMCSLTVVTHSLCAGACLGPEWVNPSLRCRRTPRCSAQRMQRVMLFQPCGIPHSHHRIRAPINQAEKLSLSVRRLLDEAHRLDSCWLFLCGTAAFAPSV